MFIGRLIGRLLLVGAFAVLCRDLFGLYELGAYMPASLGTLWSDLHETSRETVLGHVPDWLFHPLLAIMTLPAAATLALFAIVVLWVSRRRAGRRRR